MSTSTKLFEVLNSLLLQLPSLLTMLGCIVFAIISWKRHPRVSLTVIISLALLLLVTFGFQFVYSFVPDLLVKPGDFKASQTIVMVLSFFYNSFWGIALAVLLAAIFMQRRTRDSLSEE
jgi:hypothetical protein